MMIFANQPDAIIIARHYPSREANNYRSDTLTHDIINIIEGPSQISGYAHFPECLRSITRVSDFLNDGCLQLLPSLVERAVACRTYKDSPFHDGFPPATINAAASEQSVAQALRLLPPPIT
jgi:hypothetical protein